MEKETTLLDHLQQVSLIGDDKRTVYIGPAAWLATHGYIPKKEETDEQSGD